MKLSSCKNIIWVLLLSSLTILFIYCIYLKKELREARLDVVGTYCSSIAPSSDADYFVFDREGRYYRYQQFSEVEQGEYSVDGTVITLLEKYKNRYLIFSDKLLYYVDGERNELISYRKMSSVPTFINAEQGDGS